MAKSDVLKLPKVIAGVKVPEFLRHPATIEDFLDSPVGRAVLADALAAAAAALKNYKPAAEPVGKAAESIGAAGSATMSARDAADPAAVAARQIVPAVSAEDAESGSGRRKYQKPAEQGS